MSRIFLRNAVMALLTILKWILQAAFMVLKQVFGMTKLFLVLLVLAVSGVSSIAGVTSGRR